MGRLEGKVALISGAARGQGAAEARLFVEEGARVVLGDVLGELGAEVASELGDAAHYQSLDVTSEQDWQRAVDAATTRFGRLDVLVNNAGIVRGGRLEHTSLEDYRAVIEVNQVGCFLGMRSVIPALRSAGGGSIVNISSTAGLEGVVGVVAYVASKFAIRGMTKTAALELGHDGIRVNCVHPGAIQTPMLAQDEFDSGQMKAIFGAQPIPRVGESEEIARMVLFLASDESSFSTGSEFIADGGLMAGNPARGAVGE
ncbi:MAG: glucose 1-dehydrogenase [Deltaproteobacteria bacterium]|nr:glucose 1-dehydrogenase [Deltaproteobacteria bacterium]MBW2695779.1 glucose 1-dehydrogenase [Deltaproteobacteria bacterium]